MVRSLNNADYGLLNNILSGIILGWGKVSCTRQTCELCVYLKKLTAQVLGRDHSDGTR